MDRIPSRNLPNFIRMSDPNARAIFASHHVCDPDDGCMTVHPSDSLTFGELVNAATMDSHPTIRLKTSGFPTALVFAPSTEELRALGEAFIETANRIEAKAKADAVAALDKAMKGGK